MKIKNWILIYWFNVNPYEPHPSDKFNIYAGSGIIVFAAIAIGFFIYTIISTLNGYGVTQ